MRDIFAEVVEKNMNKDPEYYSLDDGSFHASDAFRNPLIMWLKYNTDEFKFCEETKRIMTIGSAIHEYIQNNIEGMIPEVEISINTGLYKIKGRMDLYDPKENTIYEIKTCSSFKYKPYKQHLGQLSIYMTAKAANEGVLVYINKKDGSYKNILITYQEAQKYYREVIKYFDFIYNIINIKSLDTAMKLILHSKYYKDTLYEIKYNNLDYIIEKYSREDDDYYDKILADFIYLK